MPLAWLHIGGLPLSEGCVRGGAKKIVVWRGGEEEGGETVVGL